MNLRRILSQAALVIGALVFSIGLQAYAATFAIPTSGFPNGDAQAPLDTGPNANVKAGGLVVNSGGAPNGLLVPSGNVGIGTVNPLSKLHTYVTGNNNGAYIEGNMSGNVQTLLLSPDSTVGAFVAGCTKPDGTTSHGSDGCGRLILQGTGSEGFQFQTSNVASGAHSWSTKVAIKNNGAVQLGVNPLGTCSSAEAGSIKYDGTDLMGCVGGAWKSLTATGGGAPPPGSQTWSTPGTYTFIVPAGVTNLKTIQVWGGGGGGASGTSNWGSSGGGGGGGGFGQVVNYPVTSGATFTVVVGDAAAGGQRGGNWDVCTGGQSGKSSSFGPFTASGGGGGTSGSGDSTNSTSSCNGGSPGSASGPGIIPTSGAGGENGRFGDQQTGGNGGAGANGGAGGSGAGYGGTPGPGTAPGGGGGGGFSGSGTSGVYGSYGAPGQVIVTW